MKRAWIALALALALSGSLTACGRDEDRDSGDEAQKASRRQTSTAQQYTRQFVQDGRYSAGADGRLAGGRTGHDLEGELKSRLHQAEDAARDAGKKVGDAARDLGKDLKQNLEQSAGGKKS